jgi:hypothetical protein
LKSIIAMRPNPTKINQVQKSPSLTKSTNPKIILLFPALVVVMIIALGFNSINPNSNQSEGGKNISLPTNGVKLESSPSAEEKSQQHSQEKGEQSNTLNAYWGSSVSQVQFYFDNVSTPANCSSQNCTVAIRQGVNQIYMRWFNISENQWYYFQCPGNYRGQFEGIPYSP